MVLPFPELASVRELAVMLCNTSASNDIPGTMRITDAGIGRCHEKGCIVRRYGTDLIP